MAHGPSRSPISPALLAGIAFIPIVVAAGFLADRDPPAPGDISLAALRGSFDAAPVDGGAAKPAQAGY